MSNIPFVTHVPSHRYEKEREVVTDTTGLYGVWLDGYETSFGPRGTIGVAVNSFENLTGKAGRAVKTEGLHVGYAFVGTREQAEHYRGHMQAQYSDIHYRVLPYDATLPGRIAEVQSRVEKAHPSEREWAIKQAAADVARLLGEG